MAKEATIARLRTAAERGTSFFPLLFHDGYFCDYYREYRDWYVWLIEYLKTEGYALCSYRDALQELNRVSRPTGLPEGRRAPRGKG